MSVLLECLRRIDVDAREGRAIDARVPETLAAVVASLAALGAALLVRDGDALVVRGAVGILAARAGERLPVDDAPARLASEGGAALALVSAALATSGGEELGALVVATSAARPLDEGPRALLDLVADRVAGALRASRGVRRDNDGMDRRFKAIFEAALDGIMLTDDALRIVDLNPEACRLLGRPREALVGATSSAFLSPTDRAHSAERMGELVAAGALRGETAMRMPDGAMRRVEYGAVANIAPGLHLSLFRDVEDRRRAEEAQHFLDEATRVLTGSLDYDETLASVARLAVPRIADWAAVDLLDDAGAFRRVAVAHVDPQKVALAHDLWKRQHPGLGDPTGVGAVVRTGQSELVERVNDEMLVAALEHDPELLAIIRELGLVSAMTVPISVRGQTAGAISLISAESLRRFGSGDLAVAEDLARRASHAIENALAMKELRETTAAKDLFLRRTGHLQATAARLVRAQSVEDIARAFASEDCTTGLDAHGGALFTRSGDAISVLATTASWSDAAEVWREIPLATDVPLTIVARTGEPIWIRDTEDFRARYPSVPMHTVQPQLVARVVLPLNTPDGCIGILALAFTDPRSFDAQDREYLTAVANLWANALHRALLAESEREALRRAIDAETLATRKKDEFLAMLGHELRNPLSPILTATSLIRARGRASNRELEIIERQARHLVRLVGDLLDVSKIASGKLPLKRESVDVGEVVAQATEATARAFEDKRVRVCFDLGGEPLRVSGDHERLVQVVTNLLVNASKFTPADRAVYVAARREGDGARVEVRDEGAGIDPEFLPRVFDVFTQERQSSDRKHGGLGLGLAIARSIVTAHGGTIEARSGGPGTGATFSLVLPLDATEERRPSPSATFRAALAPEKRRVLIVDDNTDSAEMLAEYLGDIGYDPLVAHDAKEALSLACERAPDAAILDIGLPDVDGYELAREITTRLGPRAPTLIALTGYAEARDREHALQSGFVAHFAKPVDMAELAGALRSILRARETPPP